MIFIKPVPKILKIIYQVGWMVRTVKGDLELRCVLVSAYVFFDIFTSLHFHIVNETMYR